MGVFGSRAFPYPSITIFALGTAGTKSHVSCPAYTSQPSAEHAITHQARLAILVLAPSGIVDTIAVANTFSGSASNRADRECASQQSR